MKEEMHIFRRIWLESSSYWRRESIDTWAAWEKVDHINRTIDSRKALWMRVGYVFSGIAASLLVVLGLSFMDFFHEETGVSVRVEVAYGSRSDVVLPDGSLVKLNAGSEILYTYNKEGRIREVVFQGEGFFDVAKNEDPFVIRMANGLRLKVHGTSFNLQAYADEKTVEAALVEGCIELDHNGNTHMMKAGDMVVFDKQSEEIKPVSGELSHSYSWLEDKLYMEHMSLASICKYMERKYNVTIYLPESLGNSIHYDGVIQEESVKEILDVLSRLSDIDYRVNGKNISITSK